MLKNISSAVLLPVKVVGGLYVFGAAVLMLFGTVCVIHAVNGFLPKQR